LALDFFVDIIIAAHAVEDAGYGQAHGGGCDVVGLRFVCFEGSREKEKSERDAREMRALS